MRRRPDDIVLFDELNEKLEYFSAEHEMIGINDEASKECFIEQIIDSIRRIKYVTTIRDRHLDISVTDPNSDAFDPIKAASWHRRNGNDNEALWLIFLLTHFGKNKTTKWQLLRDVYGSFGSARNWTWDRVSNHIEALEMGNWIDINQNALKLRGRFGNHRKYESLNFTGTGNAILSYLAWVGPEYDHSTRFAAILQGVPNLPKNRFDSLYNSMNDIFRFGRTGKFDYLTMIGKLGILNIEPPSTYMNQATGPYRGGLLLLAGDINSNLSRQVVEDFIFELDERLDLYFGMQVLEDALCNWQKSPNNYIYFNG